MKIQVISYNKTKDNGNIVYTKLSSPRSFDEYDFNIIDISDEQIWYCDHDNPKSINCINDFASIKIMIENSKTTKIVFVYPQNCLFHYHRYYNPQNKRGDYYSYESKRMKDNLDNLERSIFPSIFPINSAKIIFENTTTPIGNQNYEGSFYFHTKNEVLTKSTGSEKATSIRISERWFATTLNITKNDESVENFTKSLFDENDEEIIPNWMDEITFFNDDEQNTIIENANKRIAVEKEKIRTANAILANNSKYKSILYINGDKLVDVVFEMLEKMLDCSLEDFVDIKKEDFRIKKDDFTLIGEIKGINTNVKNANVSQLDNNYQLYCDELKEEGRTENVHQILIINPLRERPLLERDPVPEAAIQIAKRNGSLIIETKTLLKIFELFLQGRISTEECEKAFLNNTGLLTECAFAAS